MQEFDFKHSSKGHHCLNYHWVFFGGARHATFVGDSAINRNFKGSDVDLFLYDLTPEEAMQKLHAINQHLFQKARSLQALPPLYARTKGSLTFSVGEVSVQVILRLYKSRPEVLMAFDLDSCAVGYDG